MSLCEQLGGSFVSWFVVEPHGDDHPGAPASYPAKRDGRGFARAWLVAEIARCIVHVEQPGLCLSQIRDRYVQAGFDVLDWEKVIEVAKECGAVTDPV